MESRIIAIYCHHHPTEYWYDIDNRLKDKRYFNEAQICGNGKMLISPGDDVYILCRYDDRDEIKYKCRVEKANMAPDGEIDPYEHNRNGFTTPYYFKAKFIEAYEDGNFPLETLREFELVSKHNQLNGDKVKEPLLEYIKSNARIIPDF